MINLLKENISVLNGLESIKLYSKYDNVVSFLKENNIKFKNELWPNKGCSPEIPWEIIRIDNSISLFFAKGKLWKIYLENNYSGALNNGIKLGMKLNDALKIDNTLKYDDWDEVYVSNYCYDIEDNLNDGTIMSISIYIKEMLNEEIFYKYEW